MTILEYPSGELLARWFSAKSSCSKATQYDGALSLSHEHMNGLLSNGTHEFKKTVLLISLDGLR